MRKTVYRLYPVWKYDEEEKWLRDMADEGWALVSVGFCRYEFDETRPGQYDVALDLLESHAKSAPAARYIAFLEEAGWEHVGSFGRWAYFRRVRDGETARLYSDRASRAKYLARVFRLTLLVGGLNFWIGGMNLILYGNMGIGINLLGLVNFGIGFLSGYGAGKIWKKKKALEGDTSLFQ